MERRLPDAVCVAEEGTVRLERCLAAAALRVHALSMLRVVLKTSMFVLFYDKQILPSAPRGNAETQVRGIPGIDAAVDEGLDGIGLVLLRACAHQSREAVRDLLVCT